MSRSEAAPDATIERIADARAYLAAPGLEGQLAQSLDDVRARHGGLFVAGGEEQHAPWAANVWRELYRVQFASIAAGARALRSLHRNWWPCETSGLHRRTTLLQERLAYVPAPPLVFPTPAPSTPLGSWTLLDAGTILCSPHCSSPFPNGEVRFVEDRSGPPNRAYLKLWEALTLLGRHPVPGELCLDAGASPGGWTWVVARTGAHVLAVDRAPLAAAVAALPNVRWREGSAFAVQPTEASFDWIFSDVACYPERLWTWADRWLRSGRVRNMVLTLKFQGAGDERTVARFLAVAGGRLLHLHHNKHELTFLWSCRPEADSSSAGDGDSTGQGGLPPAPSELLAPA